MPRANRWHVLPARTVLRQLKSSPRGLTDREAAARLKEYGPNRIERADRLRPLAIFAAQFRSVLIWLLLIATAISLFLGQLLDAAAISAIVVLNAALGFVQEWRAERAIEALRRLAVPQAIVMRNGKQEQVFTEQLVLGDIVVLNEGDKVPADLRLIEAHELQLGESLLTGESTPVPKHIRPLPELPLAERRNLAFMGTTVTLGHGLGVVVATGMSTAMGSIARLVQAPREVTPLQRRLEAFGKWLGLAVAMAAVGVFLLGLSRGQPVYQIFLTAVALAVSAVPEGLPVVVTVTLAAGVLVMSRRNAIIRKLSAVETLGSTTVICADKTGTMTTNEMTVRQVWAAGKAFSITGVGFRPEGRFKLNGRGINPHRFASLELLLTAGAVANNSALREEDGWRVIGDPTEGALLAAARKAGLSTEDYHVFDELPFTSGRRRMTVAARHGTASVIFSKGAPETMLELCDRIELNGIRKLTSADRQRIMHQVHLFAERGLRVLALAYRPANRGVNHKQLETKLIFLGLTAMEDPPRPEVAHALKVSSAAGVRTIMLTGDHAATAQAVAREIGLPAGRLLTGADLDHLDDAELEGIIDDVSIFARVSPEHKVRIVQALKRKGHTVAVTGDGINDAPAFRAADMGIAMGIKGTDVAKEAADMVLADDNYASIVTAIEEGRSVWSNIRKFVRFLLSVNFSELFLISFTIIAGLPLPLLPLQILWLNLVTDGLPALALGVDPKERDLMKERPRPRTQGILHGLLYFMLAAGALAFATELVAFLLSYPGELAHARTMALTTAVLFELLFVFNCRSESKPVWASRPLENRKLLLAVLASLALHALLIYVPALQAVFGTAALSLNDWLLAAGLAATSLLVLPSMFIRRTSCTPKADTVRRSSSP